MLLCRAFRQQSQSRSVVGLSRRGICSSTPAFSPAASAVAAAATAAAASSAAAAAAAAPAAKRLRWCFLGAPGVGKGTFAGRIAPHFNIPTISSGDLIRDEIKRGTKLGQEIKAINDRGQLVGDDIVTRMVSDRLAKPDCAPGFILDGYPRRLSQAELLRSIVGLDMVLNIDLREDVLVQKAISRRVCRNCGKGYNIANIQLGEIKMPPLLPKKDGICDKCGGGLIQRDDDTEAIVRDRLQVYHSQTKPLIDYYNAAKILVSFQVLKGLDDTPRLIDLLTQHAKAK